MGLGLKCGRRLWRCGPSVAWQPAGEAVWGRWTWAAPWSCWTPTPGRRPAAVVLEDRVNPVSERGEGKPHAGHRHKVYRSSHTEQDVYRSSHTHGSTYTGQATHTAVRILIKPHIYKFLFSGNPSSLMTLNRSQGQPRLASPDLWGHASPNLRSPQSPILRPYLTQSFRDHPN